MIPKKVLITGADGSIGRLTVQYLRKAGHRVVPADDFLAGPPEEFPEEEFDWLLHFAARTAVNESFRIIYNLVAENVNSTLKALQLAEKTGAAFLYPSTYMYGEPIRFPVDENHPLDIRNPYTLSKYLSEQACLHIRGLQNLPVLILRIFTVFGPGFKQGRLVSDLFTAAAEGRELVVNNGQASRDHLYVDDLNELLENILYSEPETGLYNVGSGISLNNLDAAKIIRETFGSVSPVRVLDQPRRNEVMSNHADISRICARYGWKPRTGFRDGIEKMKAILRESATEKEDA